MPVPENVIVLWPGTNGSIPAGWSRVTDMDTRHPKGTAAGTNPNVTGGASTHTHANANHPHTTSHGHGVVTSGGPTGANRRGTGRGSVASHSHTHTGTPSNSGSTTGSGSDSWDSDSNQPNSYQLIYIKSAGSPAGLPDGCVALFNSGLPLLGGHNTEEVLLISLWEQMEVAMEAGQLVGTPTLTSTAAPTLTV